MAEEKSKEDLQKMKEDAFESLQVAVTKFHEYACALPLGDERCKAFAIYQAARIVPCASNL